MAEIKYTVIPSNLVNVGYEDLSTEDKSIAQSLLLNSSFDETLHKVELHIYSLDGALLYSDSNFRGAQQLLNSVNGSNLYLDTQQDIVEAGYENGGVRVIYNFLQEYSNQQFIVKEISEDRTELKVFPFNTGLSVTDIVNTILEDLANTPYFPEFRLNLGSNDLLIGINIAEFNGEIIVKLYEPLPAQYSTKQLFSFVKRIADSAAFELQSEFTPDPPRTIELKGANFSVDAGDINLQSTEYLSYDNLYNYPVTSSYHQTLTALSQSGAAISIDYTDYAEYIHFSSAEERLRNFNYKVGLLEEYAFSASIATNYQPHYDNLIANIISKFDGYEKFLYFESGSKSWPKINSTTPYINDTVLNATAWYNEQIASASLYDELNESRLTYTTPAFIREDSTNAPYELFLDMIGQHFDNLWIYAKAVTDKYDADNRLNYGVSKDLIADVLKGFGVKLYSSNFGVSSLAANLLGEFYNTGSEQINTFVTASNDPTPDKDILQETYKRIYHNLPYLIKTKGTERGLRALINTFGIPSGSLSIYTFGGVQRPGSTPYFASAYPTGSKIRLENTGSIVPGGTLSQYTSIQKDDQKFTQDQHIVEAGFSPTYNIDNYILDNITGSFNIDQYIGDPRYLYSKAYNNDTNGNLKDFAETLLSGSDAYDVFDFVRLIKFFDNQLFKMVKDFLPARDVTTSGIIIKPHLLNRSKVQSAQATYTRPEYTASIDTLFVTGSDGGVINEYSTAHTASVLGLLGTVTEIRNTEVEKINGELGGSLLDIYGKSLNEANVLKISPNDPLLVYTSSGSGQINPPAGEFYWRKGDMRGSGGSYTGVQVKYIYINEIDENGVNIENALTNLKPGDKITFTVRYDNQGLAGN